MLVLEVVETIIDRQYYNGNSLIEYLRGQQQLTFLNEAENNFRKTILLSAASYFEKEISECIIELAKLHTNGNDLIVSIVKQKAVSRQYHTYFDWERATNANSFFALFGEEFKGRMIKKVKENQELHTAIKAFLEIGQERNKIVHQNFGEIVIDKTAEEIYGLYKSSLFFIEIMKRELLVDSIEEIRNEQIN